MNNHMIRRLIFFAAVILIPIVFGWWLFIPLALLYVYAVKKPFELILSGFLLDTVYYFGNGFFRDHALVIFSLILVALVLFLDSRIYWRKFM
jgi:hypothetical protein